MKNITVIFLISFFTNIALAQSYSIINRVIRPGTSVLVDTSSNGLVSYSCPGSPAPGKSWYCAETLNKYNSAGHVIGEIELSGTSSVSKLEAFKEMITNCPKVVHANGFKDTSICGTLSPSYSALKCKAL